MPARAIASFLGSSPHTRGALVVTSRRRLQCRIIPAYAGSTPTEAKASPRRSGSSPHTRGALAKRNAAADWGRIIPAYAGSTQRWRLRRIQSPDHPRIRGEHFMPARAIASFLGSSPHTRGALVVTSRRRLQCRIIPAYAGSTPTEAKASPRRSGSSPHTRGALAKRNAAADWGRIIPAYAGSTQARSASPWRWRDHPRIRGEHVLLSLSPRRQRGSSPHTRGALD